MSEKPDQESKPVPKPPTRLPKLCGADMELGNFVLGDSQRYDTCNEAARAVLREIEGQPQGSAYPRGPDRSSTWSGRASDSEEDSDGYLSDSHRSSASDYSKRSGYYGGSGYSYSSQDWGRKYLRSNGGCAYIDLEHIELCIPEVVSAHDHVACSHAMLLIARQAQMAANEKMSPGQRIQVMANNSDGRGHSYGSHLNFLVTRRAWNKVFHRKLHHLLYLASYQVSSIVFTGQGKVGSENGRPSVSYQISSRADFFETLVGEQTTYRRPIVNSRDETLCGDEHMARLHVIFYDNSLCHVAGLLKVGGLQIVLTAIECERINPNLILDDPLSALLAWSHDPTLRARAKTVSGLKLTAVELQMLFLEELTSFVEAGGCDGIVPRAREILALWGDTLGKLRSASTSNEGGALAVLAPRLDWVLKLSILRRAMKQHPELAWDSPQIRHLDQLYSSVAPDGLYWVYEKQGFVERVVTEAEIERFVHEPPEETRAWTRAMLLRIADPETVAHVDWDSIRFKFRDKDYWPRYRTLDLGNPLAFTKAQSEPILRQASSDLEEILNALGVPSEDRSTGSTEQSHWWGRAGAASTTTYYPLARTTLPKAVGEPRADEFQKDSTRDAGGQSHEIS